MKRIVIVALLFPLFFSCAKKETVDSEAKTDSNIEHERKIGEAKKSAVRDFVFSLGDDVKISQIFLVNIEGEKKYHSVEKTSDGKPLVPGGCLLFSYNIAPTAAEFASFTKSIRDFYAENGNIPPYIAVDQEGGKVNRLKKVASALPSQKWIAENLSFEKAFELYESQATQMKNLGVNMNLAPVVEVENGTNEAFLDTRSFGSLDEVLSFSKNAVTAYEKNGIGTVLKHFPGNSGTDPHTGLPEIEATKLVLEESYLLPFKTLLPFSSAVLMSHARIFVPDDERYNSDRTTPACLSKLWVSDIVRKQYGFSNLVLSDDIFMGALADNGFPPERAAVQAIAAGVDVIMLSEKKFGSVAKILQKKAREDSSFKQRLEEAVRHVVEYKIKAGLLKFEEIESESGELEFRVCMNEAYPLFDESSFKIAYEKGMELIHEAEKTR